MESPAPTGYEPGATVLASDGEVGTVEEVVTDRATGEPSLLAVRLEDGRRVEIPFAMIDAAGSEARRVRLLVDRATLIRSAPAGTGETGAGVEIEPGERIVIPTYEEVQFPTTREVEL